MGIYSTITNLSRISVINQCLLVFPGSQQTQHIYNVLSITNTQQTHKSPERLTYHLPRMHTHHQWIMLQYSFPSIMWYINYTNNNIISSILQGSYKCVLCHGIIQIRYCICEYMSISYSISKCWYVLTCSRLIGIWKVYCHHKLNFELTCKWVSSGLYAVRQLPFAVGYLFNYELNINCEGSCSIFICDFYRFKS